MIDPLAFPRAAKHLLHTAENAKSSRSAALKAEHVVVYRGIKIEPINGKRSAVSKVIRDALFKKPVKKVRQAKSA